MATTVSTFESHRDVKLVLSDTDDYSENVHMFDISYSNITKGNVKFNIETYVTIDTRVCMFSKDFYLCNTAAILHAVTGADISTNRAGTNIKYAILSNNTTSHLLVCVEYTCQDKPEYKDMYVDSYLTCTTHNIGDCKIVVTPQ